MNFLPMKQSYLILKKFLGMRNKFSHNKLFTEMESTISNDLFTDDPTHTEAACGRI